MHNEIYMQRCLDLAIRGIGMVSPNPMVGCVIVHNNEIIGEGWHEKYGSAHAEVNAINAVLNRFGEKAASILKESTIYVSLEPCAHFGKTPPCADLIIKHQLKKVYVGCRDPFPAVAGKGIERILENGIDVEVGIKENACLELNKRFFTRVLNQRPYIILKWAQTKNGFYAPLDRSQHWISGKAAKNLVHKWRAEEDAILIGKNTALTDNPSLTTRNWAGKNPIRVVLDRNLEIPEHFNLYNNEAQTIILNANKTEVSNNIRFISIEDMDYYLPQKILYQLHLLDIQSVIIEGGAKLLNAFINEGLWDEVRVFTSPDNWENGLPAPIIEQKPLENINVGKDILSLYKNAK